PPIPWSAFAPTYSRKESLRLASTAPRIEPEPGSLRLSPLPKRAMSQGPASWLVGLTLAVAPSSLRQCVREVPSARSSWSSVAGLSDARRPSHPRRPGDGDHELPRGPAHGTSRRDGARWPRFLDWR